MSIELYNSTCEDISRKIALNYSTSFSLGIKLLGKQFRAPVFNIYGFVRLADEIVDTFHNHDKAKLLAEFKEQTYRAIADGISTNPVLHAFQNTARNFDITKELIEPFFHSMEQDLETAKHSQTSYKEYIYGSAEVVGLMCLKVFCKGKNEQYQSLLLPARSLGSAFQKVNFLRDIKSDLDDRGRTYFPDINFEKFTDTDKKFIISDVKEDFTHALNGIKKLPVGARRGVYCAYVYYLKLLEKIEKTDPSLVLEKRIRIPNYIKMVLLAKSYVQEKVLNTV